jgi:hypothetical protein
VRTICRVITTETESDLVEQAKHMTSNQLERFVSALSRRQRAHDADAVDQDKSHCEDRSLNLWLNDDGSWTIRGVVPADVGTLLRRALDAQTARHAKANRDGIDDAAASSTSQSDTQTERFEALRVDALVELVSAGHTALAAGADVEPRPLIVIHRYPDGDELENGPPIPSTVAQQYACDADIVTATHEAETNHEMREGIRLSRRRRTPTDALRRSLKERDQGCRWPGCSRRYRLHAHHIIEYTNNGPTNKANLLTLFMMVQAHRTRCARHSTSHCSRHHPLLHRHGWTITGNPNGTITFNRPGLVWPKLVDANIERVLDLANHPAGPFPVFRDGRLDLDLAVMAMLHNSNMQTANTQTAKTTGGAASRAA